MPGLTPYNPIPAGGDLVISCSNPGCASNFAELRVEDRETGEIIEGEIVRRMDNERDGWLVFRPTTPLTAGQIVGTTLVEGVAETAWQEFYVAEPMPFDASAIYASSWVDPVATPMGALHCCDSRPCPNCDAACFGDRTRVTAIVNVGVSISAVLSQYLFQATITGEGIEPIVSEVFPVQGSAQIVLETATSSYCYLLVAESIADGTRTEVAQDCMDNSVSIGEHATPRTDREQAHLACPTPIEGIESEWCQVWEASCVQRHSVSERACESAAAHCDQTDGGAAEADGGTTTRHGGDGSLCSTSQGSSTSHWLGFTWFAGLVLLLRRARRASALLSPHRATGARS